MKFRYWFEPNVMVLKFIWETIVLPSINPFEFEEEIFSGSDAQLACYVSRGDQPLTIWWTLNGAPLTSNATIGVSTVSVGTKTSLLTLTGVDYHSAGEYRCFAENPAGQTSHSANLTVYGKKSNRQTTSNLPSFRSASLKDLL